MERAIQLGPAGSSADVTRVRSPLPSAFTTRTAPRTPTASFVESGDHEAQPALATLRSRTAPPTAGTTHNAHESAEKATSLPSGDNSAESAYVCPASTLAAAPPIRAMP